MADLRDQYGNPIQLADEYGNPVQLTDEYGNPMKLSGVAMASGSTSALHSATAAVKEPFTGSKHQEPQSEQQGQLRRSSSSSSSSSEDDGQGGRRKKKGLKEKIKEKFSGGKNKDDEPVAHSAPAPAPAPTTTTTTTGGATSTTTAGLHPEHEKKSMMEKIKEKLPGHHEHH